MTRMPTPPTSGTGPSYAIHGSPATTDTGVIVGCGVTGVIVGHDVGDGAVAPPEADAVEAAGVHPPANTSATPSASHADAAGRALNLMALGTTEPGRQPSPDCP